MATYYNGDLDKDLESIANLSYLDELKAILDNLPCGRTQQLLEMLGSGTEFSVTVFETRHLHALEELRERYTARRLIEVIQILWAEILRDMGSPTIGALGSPE